LKRRGGRKGEGCNPWVAPPLAVEQTRSHGHPDREFIRQD
jgi:hypothetical protein